MFTGSYNHSIDEKGRVIIPRKFREELGENFIITTGLDKCLTIMPEKEWNEYIAHLKNMVFEKKNSRSYVRFILAHTSFLSFDNQGRITIPQNLRNYASLVGKSVITGIIDRIEIWDEQAWNEYNSISQQNFEKFAEELETE